MSPFPAIMRAAGLTVDFWATKTDLARAGMRNAFMVLAVTGGLVGCCVWVQVHRSYETFDELGSDSRLNKLYLSGAGVLLILSIVTFYFEMRPAPVPLGAYDANIFFELRTNDLGSEVSVFKPRGAERGVNRLCSCIPKLRKEVRTRRAARARVPGSPREHRRPARRRIQGTPPPLASIPSLARCAIGSTSTSSG